jgi:hypothetical protein
MATVDYLVAGGDGYTMYSGIELKSQALLSEALVDAIKVSTPVQVVTPLVRISCTGCTPV